MKSLLLHLRLRARGLRVLGALRFRILGFKGLAGLEFGSFGIRANTVIIICPSTEQPFIWGYYGTHYTVRLYPPFGV